MNPYQYPLSCDVCGGPGVGTSSANYAAWRPINKWGYVSTITHRDPSVCQYYLSRKRAELNKLLEDAKKVNATV
jgi:hypothetical protein